MPKTKIILSTIAKDEGAYIAEWIFHHLKLGVDHIQVMVNKTSDSTREQLNNIARNHPVSVFEADELWTDSSLDIDSNIEADFLSKNRFQARALTTAYQYANAHGYDYAIFLDVDEFWYFSGYDNLSDFLQKNEYDYYRFRWFNLSGDKKPFKPALKAQLKGDFVPLNKIMLKTNIAQLVFKSPHAAKSPAISSEYKSNKDGLKACILHRYVRSEPEYIGMLYRGDVLHTTHGLKANRMGYDNQPEQSILVDSEALQSYKVELREFITNNKLDALIDQEQENVLARVTKVEEIFSKLKQSELDELNIFRNTRFQPDLPPIKFWKNN